MPDLTLSDGRKVAVARVAEHQLKTDIAFNGRRSAPEIVEVVQVDGKGITPAKLVVGDSYSLWLNHQTDLIPRRGGDPAVPTGLTSQEGTQARGLFLQLANGSSDFSGISARPQRWHLLAWLGRHVAQVVGTVIAAIITAVILTWLRLGK